MKAQKPSHCRGGEQSRVENRDKITAPFYLHATFVHSVETSALRGGLAPHRPRVLLPRLALLGLRQLRWKARLNSTTSTHARLHIRVHFSSPCLSGCQLCVNLSKSMNSKMYHGSRWTGWIRMDRMSTCLRRADVRDNARDKKGQRGGDLPSAARLGEKLGNLGLRAGLPGAGLLPLREGDSCRGESEGGGQGKDVRWHLPPRPAPQSSECRCSTGRRSRGRRRMCPRPRCLRLKGKPVSWRRREEKCRVKNYTQTHSLDQAREVVAVQLEQAHGGQWERHLVVEY